MNTPEEPVESVRVSPSTLTITHVYDGQEVVSGGDDGQVWVATFASHGTAVAFCNFAKGNLFNVVGDRRKL